VTEATSPYIGFVRNSIDEYFLGIFQIDNTNAATNRNFNTATIALEFYNLLRIEIRNAATQAEKR
jgi:hypothetical protein